VSGDPRRALGRVGERIAATHLEAAGYEILERNFRTRFGELDLVAASATCLVFCEVKTRIERAPAAIGPLASVGAGKRRRLRMMAGQWLVRRAAGPRPHPDEIRFDAIGITLAPDGRLCRLDHLEGAF
jgi:putative endonuclease